MTLREFIEELETIENTEADGLDLEVMGLDCHDGEYHPVIVTVGRSVKDGVRRVLVYG